MSRYLASGLLLFLAAFICATASTAALPPNGTTQQIVTPSMVGEHVEYICDTSTPAGAPGGGPIILSPNTLVGIAMGQRFVVTAGPQSGPGGQWVQLDMSDVKPGVKGWVLLKCVKVIPPIHLGPALQLAPIPSPSHSPAH